MSQPTPNAAPAPRRRSKWDVPAPEVINAITTGLSSTPSPPSSTHYPGVSPASVKAADALLANVSVVNAAALAAEKINRILGAQPGIIKQADGFGQDISINDCRPDVRFLLTKGSTQDQLFRDTGVSVVTRGKYKAPNATTTTNEPPLYLHVTGPTLEILEKGMQQIENIIASGSATGMSCKVFINIDNPDLQFGVVPKLLGPKGEYVKHISTETKAKVQLHGIGSGYLDPVAHNEGNERLHLFIQAPNKQSLDSAKTLAENLVDTVRKQHKAFVDAKRPAYIMMYPGGMPYYLGYPQARFFIAFTNLLKAQNPYPEQNATACTDPTALPTQTTYGVPYMGYGYSAIQPGASSEVPIKEQSESSPAKRKLELGTAEAEIAEPNSKKPRLGLTECSDIPPSVPIQRKQQQQTTPFWVAHSQDQPVLSTNTDEFTTAQQNKMQADKGNKPSVDYSDLFQQLGVKKD